MTREIPLSMDHMEAVLDNAPVAIYVSALDDFQLLYANQQARRLLMGGSEAQKGTCFQAAGYEEPCPFCRAELMSRSELSVREFLHPETRRVYQLSGKIIDWGGRVAHIEYIVDITEKKREEDQTRALKERLEATFSSIPCGLCVYQFDGERIHPVFHNPAFYEIMGYSQEHIQRINQETNFLGVHSEDVKGLTKKVHEAISQNGMFRHTYRVFNDREGEYRWIHLDASVKPQTDGKKLLYGVYGDVSEQVRLENELAAANVKMREAQQELDHLVNSIPGGIASYRVEGTRFIPTFFSDGIMELSGHTREEYEELIRSDAMDIVYEPDRERVLAAAQDALVSGEVLDVSYRMRHKNGSLIWIHLNGKRMGSLSEVQRFYAVFTGMSAESHMYQNLSNAAADGIYVIDQRSYELLYVNESEKLFMGDADCVGQKCYEALHHKSEPCEFCTLKTHLPDGKEHELPIEDSDCFYSTRFQETDWNGIPAYVKYVRDVTEEVKTRREKERLEQYFQMVVKYLPGGVAVVRYEKDGRMVPEFLSDGFASMTGMELEEAWRLYRQDAMTGVHPEDRQSVNEQMDDYIASGENHCEIVYRLKKGKEGYLWVKNTLSLIENEGGERRVYAVYHDVSKEREEQERIRQQYKDMILQHYSAPDPNTLIMGHCNITQNKILEIIDHTDSGLLENFGSVREEFFTGISNLVVDEEERKAFRETYLNEPALAAFERDDTEQILKCFVKLPQEDRGRYVQFKVNLIETPDTGDITGILTVTDITEQIISDGILHQLSVTSYDFVIDLDLDTDCYTILTANQSGSGMPKQGSHTKWVAKMLETALVPKDKEQYAKALEPQEIRRRLTEEGPYTFAYSVTDEKGDIRTKNMTVSAVDLRLGRVCLVRTDITDSLREQQGLLNMMAYAFELMGYINIHTNRLTMYTRNTVLKNLSPYVSENYDAVVERFAKFYGTDEDQEEVRKKFCLKNILHGLSERPAGYDFVFPYQSEGGLRYKQINVLWGDENHRTVCMVRADVTDMLAAERETKRTLERTLVLAKEANRAKSDFMSAMSHDIRTPMNAIMGMTALAEAHLDDRDRVEDCLNKISISSKHLLSLINDVLDMSKIERSKIALNRMRISLPQLMDQLSAIMKPQAKTAGLEFRIERQGISHEYFYGDSLRINQILINILSNAIKFTPEGGTVEFLVKEIPIANALQRVRYRFIISDTGHGMSEEFLAHAFEPFTRSSATARIEGTGLGLSITKGLVDLMGGEISAESRIDEGTVFRVELEFEVAGDEAEEPRGPEDGYNLEKMIRKETGFEGRQFLVAEDNAINAEILCELLRLYGAESVVRTDGAQAVREFEARPPKTYDAILMDIQMPEMNGYEATRAIRKLERADAKVIPIIAMTANAFAEDVQAALEAGMDAHVSKPIDPVLLRTSLKKLLERA